MKPLFSTYATPTLKAQFELNMLCVKANPSGFASGVDLSTQQTTKPVFMKGMLFLCFGGGGGGGGQ